MTTLATIRAEVQKFRSKNPDPSLPLPYAIKEMILNHCRSSKIITVAKALNIPVTTIYAWKKRLRNMADKKVWNEPMLSHQTAITSTNIVPLGTVGSLVKASQDSGKYEFEMRGTNNRSLRIRFDKSDRASFEQFIFSMISVL
ncbi:MAG: hypothetical protein EHM87_23585 [Burkholderiales bacterium]|nr:MAG: hypothetical protein EHM87_23585 [Burkholderiales bacterium]